MNFYQQDIKIHTARHRENILTFAENKERCYSLTFSDISQGADIDGRLKHTNYLSFCKLSDASFFSIKLTSA